MAKLGELSYHTHLLGIFFMEVVMFNLFKLLLSCLLALIFFVSFSSYAAQPTQAREINFTFKAAKANRMIKKLSGYPCVFIKGPSDKLYAQSQTLLKPGGEVVMPVKIPGGRNTKLTVGLCFEDNKSGNGSICMSKYNVPASFNIQDVRSVVVDVWGHDSVECRISLIDANTPAENDSAQQMPEANLVQQDVRPKERYQRDHRSDQAIEQAPIHDHNLADDYY